LQTECGFDGINIRVGFSSPTTGALFVKDHFTTCRVEFEDAETAALSLPFPKMDNSLCPGIEIVCKC
jgi:hypothetical protein